MNERDRRVEDTWALEAASLLVLRNQASLLRADGVYAVVFGRA